MDKEKYISLIEDHRRILEKSRRIIEVIFDRVRENVERTGTDTSSLKTSEDYETEVNIVNKLSTIFLKIAKQEQEFAQIDIEKLKQSALSEDDSEVTEIDVVIMEDYVRRYREKQQGIVNCNIIPNTCHSGET